MYVYLKLNHVNRKKWIGLYKWYTGWDRVIIQLTVSVTHKKFGIKSVLINHSCSLYVILINLLYTLSYQIKVIVSI